MRGAAADTVTINALARSRGKARICGEAEIIVGAKRHVIATVHRHPRALRRRQQTPHAAQAAHIAIRQFGSQLGVQ